MLTDKKKISDWSEEHSKYYKAVARLAIWPARVSYKWFSNAREMTKSDRNFGLEKVGGYALGVLAGFSLIITVPMTLFVTAPLAGVAAVMGAIHAVATFPYKAAFRNFFGGSSSQPAQLGEETPLTEGAKEMDELKEAIEKANSNESSYQTIIGLSNPSQQSIDKKDVKKLQSGYKIAMKKCEQYLKNHKSEASTNFFKKTEGNRNDFKERLDQLEEISTKITPR